MLVRVRAVGLPGGRQSLAAPADARQEHVHDPLLVGLGDAGQGPDDLGVLVEGHEALPVDHGHPDLGIEREPADHGFGMPMSVGNHTGNVHKIR